LIVAYQGSFSARICLNVLIEGFAIQGFVIIKP